MNKRDKTKQSKVIKKTRKQVLPKASAPDAPHRIPGQPIGINYSFDRSKYDPTFHPADFLKHCQEGASKKEIAAFWGISYGTIATWKDKHLEFQEAYEKGQAAQQAWLIRRAKRAAFEGSKDNNGTLIIFLLKNLCGFGDEPSTEFDDVQEVTLDINAYQRDNGSK